MPNLCTGAIILSLIPRSVRSTFKTFHLFYVQCTVASFSSHALLEYHVSGIDERGCDRPIQSPIFKQTNPQFPRTTIAFLFNRDRSGACTFRGTARS